MIRVSGVTKYGNHYTTKKQQQVMHHLVIQHSHKEHCAQNSISITICLNIQIKATKTYKLKAIFFPQMDITVFHKNQLMEVTKSIAKNEITDIPRHQRLTKI